MPVLNKLCHKLNCDLARGDGRNCCPSTCEKYKKEVAEKVATGRYSYDPTTFQVTCNICGGEAGEHLGAC